MFKTNAEPMWEDMAQFDNPPARPPLNALGWQPGWMVNDATTDDTWDSFASDHPATAPFPAYGKFLPFRPGAFGRLPLPPAPSCLAAAAVAPGPRRRPARHAIRRPRATQATDRAIRAIVPSSHGFKGCAQALVRSAACCESILTGGGGGRPAWRRARVTARSRCRDRPRTPKPPAPGRAPAWRSPRRARASWRPACRRDGRRIALHRSLPEPRS